MNRGSRRQCPDSYPTMCNEQTCGGSNDYCCASDQCAGAGGPRPCTQTPPPTPATPPPTSTPVPTAPAPAPTPPPSQDSCPWKTPSDLNDMLVCGDGTTCDVKGPEGWSCCGGKGGRAKCPRNAPTMCNKASCGAGRQEHCCALSGSTCDGGWDGERPCDAPDGPPERCPWAQHSGEDYVLECGDGTRCNVGSEGWGCCATRQQRQKCPQNYPEMCNARECSGDYCCAPTGGCDEYGYGQRPCSR